MTNIIAPTPMLGQPRDQTAVRKAFSDATQAMNTKFNAIDTHLTSIDTHLALSQNTLYPAQSYLGITIPAGQNVPIVGNIGTQHYRIWPDGTLEMWGNQSFQPIWSPGLLYYVLYSMAFPIDAYSIDSFLWSVSEILTSTFSFPGYYRVYVSGARMYTFNTLNTYTGTLYITWNFNGRWRA